MGAVFWVWRDFNATPDAKRNSDKEAGVSGWQEKS